MIKVVFDTNVIISGRLWSGTPRDLLLEADHFQSFISEALIDELKDVITRPKFAKRLTLMNTTADEVVFHHIKSTVVIETHPIEPQVEADPDDDAVLACAKAANADFVVTGDPHLLEINSYGQTRIVTPAEFAEILASNQE